MQGLQNLGSTCAINSLIQIICREPHLRNALIHYDLPENSLSGNLKEILYLMHNQNKSLAPGKFVTKLFETMNGIFQQGEQIDIGELWTFLFDKIATELNTIPNVHQELSYIDNMNTDETELAITYKNDYEYKKALINSKQLQHKYDCLFRKFNENKTSKWLETSQGFFLNIIKCKDCGNVLYNFEPFTSIPLDIPDDNHHPTLTNMLRNFLKEEKRKGDWTCSKCNIYTEYTKSIKIWKLPPVVVFIVKRFANYSSKNNKPVDVNKTICFKRGSILSKIDEDISYNLSSLGMHFGSLHGGHYCAMCNIDEDFKTRPDLEKIAFYDDINISQVNREKLYQIIEKNTDGYMIVYSTSFLST